LVQAQSALDRNKPEEAIALLSKYLLQRPADDSAHLLLAAAYVMTGRTDAAETQYQTILKHAPNNYIALAGLGELYQSTGRLEQAEPLLARAVKFSRREPQLRIEWAEVLTRLHRFKEAATALSGVAAPTSSDQHVGFLRLKAAIAEGLGNPRAAAAHMESALSIQPDNAGLQLATAAANLHAGNSKRAASLAEQVFSRSQDADAGLLLLQAQLAERNDIRQTLQSLRALVQPPNREIAFRQQLAQILIAHGETAEAVTDLNRALELDPSNPDAIFNLALAQFKAGRTKEALASAEKCKALKDSAEVEGLLGDIQETLGDNLAAARNYQGALALEPGDENHHIALALEFIRHRNFEPARLVLQQAEKSFPKSWRIQVGLGMVEYFVGTKENASKILLHAMDLAPEPESALRFLGEVELDETAAPDPPAVARICAFAKTHPKSAKAQSYCGALMFRNDYASRDTSRVDEIVRRLKFAGDSLTGDPTSHCELGKLYAWLEKWQPAQLEFEACTQLSPNSAQAHYRLSQVYHHMGQAERSREELKLYKAASQRLADENEQHETTLNTFIYSIQNKAEQ
jgi:Flp pilus assembly protein TadD